MNNTVLIDIKINEIPHICRVCLSNQTVTNILNTEYENVAMKNIFQITLNDSINTNDKGPTRLCKQCFESLIHFYQFITKYERNKPILEQLCTLAQTVANGTNSNQVSLASLDIDEVKIKQEPIDTCEERVENEDETETKAIIKVDIYKDHANTYSEEKVAACTSSTNSYVCRLCEFNAEIESPLNPSAGIATHYLRKHFLSIRNSKFRCEKCRLYFFSFDEIQEHCRSDQHQSTECPTCKTNFETMEEQYRHVKICKPQTLDIKPIEKDGKPRETKELLNETYFCHICEVNIETFEEVIKHYREKVHRLANKCMLCNKPQRLIHTHIFTHRPKRMRFGCIPCHIGFENMQDLAKHRQETNHMIIQCQLCEKMITRGNLNEHLKKHNKADQFICDVCGKVYNNKAALRAHNERLHIGKRFYCDKCFASFTSSVALKNHSIKKHNVPNKSMVPQKINDNSFYKCEHCGKRIYKYHRKTAVLHEAQHKFGHKFICPVADCMLTFPDKESRQQHKSNDHQNFVCEECEKLCYDINSFRAHSFLHTWNKNCSDPNIAKCWICNDEFVTFEILIAHLKANYGLLMCSKDNCHKIFTRNLNLNKHTSAFHNKLNR